MVLPRQVGIGLEIRKQVLIRPVGNIKRSLGRRGRILTIGEDVVWRLDEDVAQELGAKVNNVGEVLVLRQRGRGAGVCDYTGLGLDEEAVGNAEADDAGEVV